MEIHLVLNGKPVRWDRNPSEKLQDVLREEGVASVKRGCGQGDCGVCTILLDGRSVRSCLLMVGQVEGREIITVEGLGTSAKPHPLQSAFVDAGAVQCGFCTPGMLLSAKALLDEQPRPTAEQVREALDGNLCRCTGYTKIVEAVMDAASRIDP
jgi:aerobic-type carbon monoxide dehydrogenase small subunit (CoxS/CutS family)